MYTRTQKYGDLRMRRVRYRGEAEINFSVFVLFESFNIG